MKSEISEVIAKNMSKKLNDKRKNCKSISDYLDLVYSFRYDNYSVIPLQKRMEIGNLLEILKNENPKVVVEIGTADGGTLFLLSQIASSDATIISIDLPEGEYGGEFYPDWKVSFYKSFVKESQKMHLIRADSHDSKTLSEAKQILERRKIDFLLIDGDHSYNGIKKDFEMYSPLVKKGGLIAFHDIQIGPKENVGGVPEFWSEINTKFPSLEIVEKGHEDGYGIGVLFFEADELLPKYLHAKEILAKPLDINEKNQDLISNPTEFIITGLPMGALLYCYTIRQDLQKKFPEVNDGIYSNLLYWVIEHGIYEFKNILLPHKEWYEFQLQNLDNTRMLYFITQIFHNFVRIFLFFFRKILLPFSW